jgi:ABC-type Fe3+/spermidine/putrescine transport system ATPase subunit
MVEFKGILKRFGKIVAVEKMDFDIEEGSLVTLLGPSGCGKTTLLRMVAGLEEPTEGDIFIKGVRINDTPIHKRNLGMIFQNYALFPHKTIFDNVAFGLKYRNVSKGTSRKKSPGRWRWFACPAWRTACPASCPAASSSALPWRGPS